MSVTVAHPQSYLPGAEPFIYPAGDTACLLVHGFGSSPGEMRWMGAYLHQQGVTACGICLPGHGTDYRRLAHVHWQEWLMRLNDGVMLLRQQYQRVFVIGHSMGGLLTLLAASLTVQPDGIIVMGAPLVFASRMIPLARWLKYLVRFYDATDHTPLPELVRVQQAELNEPVLGRIRYDIWSVAGLAELYALAQATRARLPYISVPTCLIYSTADQTAPYENMGLIAGAIRSKVLVQHTLHESDHNLMLDGEKELVFEWAWDFIRNQKV